MGSETQLTGDETRGIAFCLGLAALIRTPGRQERSRAWMPGRLGVELSGDRRSREGACQDIATQGPASMPHNPRYVKLWFQWDVQADEGRDEQADLEGVGWCSRWPEGARRGLALNATSIATSFHSAGSRSSICRYVRLLTDGAGSWVCGSIG